MYLHVSIVDRATPTTFQHFEQAIPKINLYGERIKAIQKWKLSNFCACLKKQGFY